MSADRRQLRVTELCDGVAGPLCGRHLVLLGAQVARVEGERDDPARAWGLRAPGTLHALLAGGKDTAAGIADAEVVLADAGRVDAASLPPAGERPRLLVLFERERLADGSLVAGDTVAQAVLGLVDYVGDRWSEPARTGADVATISAGVLGVHAVMAWLLAPSAGWSTVRVSPLRALAALKTVIWAARSDPDEWSGSHVVARDRRADRGYRVDDGWVTIDFPHDAHGAWAAFCEELGVAEPVRGAGERWWETVGWGDDVDEARPVYERALRGLTREEATELVRRHGGSSVAFQAPAEVGAHPQTRTLEAAPGRLPWRVLAGALAPALEPPVGPAPESGPPLSGLRVVDFGIGGVGPFAGSLLAQLGADVVKVEAPNEFIHAVRPTADGLATTYSALNVGKRSVRLDLKQERGRAVARELVSAADVVLENFRPGAMDRLGFGYGRLSGLNPGLVYASASGFGSTGVLAKLPCTDPHIQAFAGWALTNAAADGAPRRTRYYALLDLVTALVIVEGVLAALDARRQSGAGAHVEVSMLEAVVHVHTSRWTSGAGGEEPWGREPPFAPDGLYRTTDGHVALSVEDDATWQRLLDAVGRPPALDRPEWRTNRGRLSAAAELDAALAAVLAHGSAKAWTQTIGRHDVAVGRACRDDDVVLRRDLWDDDLLRLLERAGRAPLTGGGPPWGFIPPLATVESPAPATADESQR